MHEKKWPNLSRKEMQYEIDQYIKKQANKFPGYQSTIDKPKTCSTCSNGFYCRRYAIEAISEEENQDAKNCSFWC